MKNDFKNGFEQLARDISYDEFLGLILFVDNHHIVDIKKIDNMLAIWDYWNSDTGELFRTVIADDGDAEDIRDFCESDYEDNYNVWDSWGVAFNDISTRINLLNVFWMLDPEHVPPCLMRIKGKIEELKPLYIEHLDDLNEDNCDKYICLDSRMVIDEYKYFLERNQMNEFWSRHTYSDNLTLENIDFTRGMGYEQYILGSFIQTHCKLGLKCKIKLWCVNSGFEILLDIIRKWYYDDMVLLDYYSYQPLDASILLDKYKYYLKRNQMNEFWSSYLRSLDVKIDNIDFLRGMNMEQYVLGAYIQEHCKQGFKCLICLWDMDYGFETLSYSINELVNKGMVTIDSYRWNKKLEKSRWFSI